ncbi:MAG TPA: 50S ribosomal protein L6 [Patescibacteria group bacterium]
MGRFGRLPVSVPEGVKIEDQSNTLTISGPKGTLTRVLPKGVSIKMGEKEVVIESKGDTKFSEAIKGTIRSHVTNMIKGVSEGWTKTLELVGTGYRAEVKDNNLHLTVGFSHPVIINAPEGIKFSVEKLKVKVEGMDKDKVGQVAALVRASRPPDPYKGKGVRYEGEQLKLKPGKQAAKTGAA